MKTIIKYTVGNANEGGLGILIGTYKDRLTIDFTKPVSSIMLNREDVKNFCDGLMQGISELE